MNDIIEFIEGLGVGRGGRHGPHNPGGIQAMPNHEWLELFFGIVVMGVIFALLCRNKNFVKLLGVAMWLAMIAGFIYLVQFFSVFFKATGVLR